MELLLDHSLIRAGEVVAVALSGGRDSVALLHALLGASKQGKYSVKAIHVEHGIRGAESLRDEQFVRDLCARLGVELRAIKVDVPSAREAYGSEEQTARILRYRAFEALIAEGFCDKVATAHHAGDNAETVLMRLFRGTGLTGLSGIRASRGAFIRPMLNVTRAQIDEYVRANSLEYVEDGTNACTDYTRNYIRSKVLPAVSARFDSAEENIGRLARSAKEVDAYIRREAERLISQAEGAVLIKYTDEPVLIKYAVKVACERLGVYEDVEERHLEIAVSAMMGDKKTYDFPYGLRLEREEGGLSLCVPAPVTGEVRVRIGKNVIDGRVIVVSEVDAREEGALCFSADLDGLTLRGRREGDSFKRFGGGRKSLGDYFTDVKMPLRERERAVLLVGGDNVLAVVGTEISDDVKITEKSKKIYKITEEKP